MWLPPFYHQNLSMKFEASQLATRKRLSTVAAAVPQVATGNAQIDEFYARSVLSVVLSRLDNPSFASVPFYTLGSQNGVSTNWDVSFSSSLLSLMEPAAFKGMMKLYFEVGYFDHSYVFYNGQGGGAYAEGPFSGMEMVQRYMDIVGDRTLLSFDVGGGRTVLQRLIDMGEDMLAQWGRSRTDGLRDIGGGNGR